MSEFERGDKVRNTSSLGGLFGGAVPANTEGRVVDTRHGLFDEFAVVEFKDGRTEEVKTDQLRRETGWF